MSHQNLHGDKSPSYFKSVIGYYFVPKSRSLIALLYLAFFTYFAIFYFSHVLLAIRFLYNTIMASTLALGPEHVIWGAVFLIVLIIPFTISILAITLPYEMKKRAWPRGTRIALSIILGILLFNLILLADFTLSYVEKQNPIKAFLEARNIPLKD
ncbi:MAG: hypothetical protein A3H57_03375 [Candidatus Taylorbacteria bacterium RIFCSPLOWO2_02_FULL_43_11]|uniref:Uncharacterized protein n=1 Tax=Candidatus Taylorbacteria bacterium RIFCSPHIGHO2_02_FULL_43_32b TaxID=1802306 RepID=A0A1G2MGG5_9BACT|nr:MAG: hypothetical protein A2743_02485 [Candidatus Taylorbacteria bacterium RIFCSPHIGHO2_01_FULL_43_47]OHA22259.1 MAG: hypothetical protein A3C72_04160 [Candidatus Taylorbacteria bacterium RIFCSPHIGHO2_02_FULL_43_32b]OHA29606.1 MAG: hypothetical protein A3B08_03235 [Candidatus Taylorbacteria bacterium RIFCSPLOWO2_01_FULL_43_44]OHA36144.1 MAG: hypothetical protein A3H57_03375 [Candidatus Taylorbacteria bacterium RIFCSPLOWO2_02_FULL_43_11]